jgi:hypothetical protein
MHSYDDRTQRYSVHAPITRESVRAELAGAFERLIDDRSARQVAEVIGRAKSTVSRERGTDLRRYDVVDVLDILRDLDGGEESPVWAAMQAYVTPGAISTGAQNCGAAIMAAISQMGQQIAALSQAIDPRSDGGQALTGNERDALTRQLCELSGRIETLRSLLASGIA